MDRNQDQAQYTRRHLSQLKILVRLLEHELELAKGEEVVLDKALMENTLDCLEIFIEDNGTTSTTKTSSGSSERKSVSAEAKPQVTRLN